MPGLDHLPDDAFPPAPNCLADYRDTVERLRDETIAELGRQPMPPEKASMFAVMLASLPIIALLHPAIPVHVQVWQIGLTQLTVWVGVFWLQSLRYERFQAHWRRKVAACQPEGAPLSPRLLRRPFSAASPGRPPAPGPR
jgi:hypothetical protein